MKHSAIENNMTKSVLSIRWNQPMAVAKRMMDDLKIRHLPVLADDGALTGILSDRDVKRAMKPASEQISAHSLVADYMNWPVLTVDINEPLVAVLDQMIEQKISALVVTKGNVVVGITTSEDMLKAFRDFLREDHQKTKLSLVSLASTPYMQEFVREVGAAGI